MLLRSGLIDPNCVLPTFVNGVGAVELEGYSALRVTYFVEQEDYGAGGDKLAIVAARLILPLSAILPGGLLRWARAERSGAPERLM